MGKLSHALQSLAKLISSKRKFKCTGIDHKAFKNIKQNVACNNLLDYPYFNNKCFTNTYYINLQLVAIIIQERKLISFYSRNRTVHEKGIH